MVSLLVSLRRRSAVQIPDLDRTRPVVIVKFDRNPLHHGTLGAIRSLGRAGVPVHLVQECVRAPVNRSRYVASRHAWPSPLRGPWEAVKYLHRIAGTLAGRAVLLPVDDAGAIFLSEHADSLGTAYDVTRQRPGLARSLVDKRRLAETCAEVRVPHPTTLLPSTWDEVAAAEPPDGRWPVVLKRVAPWLPPSVTGLPSSCLAHSRADLVRLAGSATASDPGLLIQEYIPGGPGQDWFFHGYYDTTRTCRFSGTGVKDRSWPAYTGSTVCGRVARNPAVRRQVDTLLRAVGYTGIVDVDLRLDPRTGRYHVLDVNPRMGAQHRLFSCVGGLDVIRAAHLDLTGRPVPRARLPEGRTFLVENFEPAAARRYIRDGRLDVRGWWRSVRSVDEYAWFARDDPLPFAAMGVRSLVEGLRHRIPALHSPDVGPSLSETVTTWST